MLTPSIGFCGTPLSTAGILQSGRFEDGRRDVDDMVELRADAALVSDARGPGDDHAVASTAEVRGNLLGPLERRVHRMGPTDHSAYRSGRRLLHYGWRSSSSWLRLSDHGGMQGRILRHRRHVLAHFFVQDFERFAGLSTKATTFTKRASFPERAHRALMRTAEIRFRKVRPPSLTSEAAKVR